MHPISLINLLNAVFYHTGGVVDDHHNGMCGRQLHITPQEGEEKDANGADV